MPTVFSANHSSLLVDGDPVEGVQSLAFRVVTEREDIIRSTATVLDDKLAQRVSFSMVAALKKGRGAEDPQRSYAFDDCYVETKHFAMGASGTAETTYVFTATRVREE
jgi:hypothetical protein